MNSADAEVNDDHVPPFWFEAGRQDEVPIAPKERNWIMENTKRVWAAMTDVNNFKVRMPHDGYLKAYQVSLQSENAILYEFNQLLHYLKCLFDSLPQLQVPFLLTIATL